MLKALWGLKAHATGENNDVFSHDQLVIAENVVNIIDNAISAINFYIGKSSPSFDREPVVIMVKRMQNVENALKHCIMTTYDIQRERGGVFTSRPSMIKTLKAKPVQAAEFPKVPIDPDIKRTIADALDSMKSSGAFVYLLKVNAMVDSFLPTLEKEMEIFSK